MTSRLLAVPEVAERLNVTERWVRRAIFERRMTVVKLGHLVRVEESEVDRLIDSGRVGSVGDDLVVRIGRRAET